MLRHVSRKGLVMLLGTMIFLTSFGVALAADPGGAATLADDPTAPVNFAWVLVAGALVFFMQAGFAFLGAGLIRSKNTVNYLTKSFMDFAMASLSFWAFGFALMFGGSIARRSPRFLTASSSSTTPTTSTRSCSGPSR